MFIHCHRSWWNDFKSEAKVISRHVICFLSVTVSCHPNKLGCCLQLFLLHWSLCWITLLLFTWVPCSISLYPLLPRNLCHSLFAHVFKEILCCSLLALLRVGVCGNQCVSELFWLSEIKKELRHNFLRCNSKVDFRFQTCPQLVVAWT